MIPIIMGNQRKSEIFKKSVRVMESQGRWIGSG